MGEYSTFEAPLVLEIAGASYTITTLRMRAVAKRIERPFALKDDETKDEGTEEGTASLNDDDNATGDADAELLVKVLGASANSNLRGASDSTRRSLSATVKSHNEFVKKTQPEEL